MDGHSHTRMDKPFVAAGPQFPPDRAVSEKLFGYGYRAEDSLREKVCAAVAPFPNSESNTRETEIGDLVADSMLHCARALKPDFAIQNGGGIRDGLAAGDITKRNLYAAVPFDNTIRVLVIKGSDLHELFERIDPRKEYRIATHCTSTSVRPARPSRPNSRDESA